MVNFVTCESNIVNSAKLNGYGCSLKDDVPVIYVFVNKILYYLMLVFLYYYLITIP